MADPLLVADIGGTNGRFALLDEDAGGGVGSLHRVKLDQHAGIADAIRSFLGAHGGGRTPRGAVLAVAGPVSANRTRLTNRDWVVEAVIDLDATDAAGELVLAATDLHSLT